MPWLHQILRRRFRIRDDLNRRRSIVRANSSRHSARRIDRYGEIRPVHFTVLRHHSLETELLRPLIRDRHADQSAPMHRHEVHILRRGLLRRHHEIAFVFAVGVVGHDDELSLGDVAHHVIDRVELKGFGRFRNHGPLMLRPSEGGATSGRHFALLDTIASALGANASMESRKGVAVQPADCLISANRLV